MSRNSNKNSVLKVSILSIISLVIAFIVASIGTIYLSLPDSFVIPETVAHTSNTTANTGLDVDTIVSNDLSIHFLELGNKYTGDCTLIKVGDVEILVDAGSRADSVSTIKSYVDDYCTDGELDYVIVTHAHQDHYAGFATSSNVDSLLDLYNVGNIIEFSKTNQKSTSTLYNNYLREKAESETRNGTKIHTVLEYVNEENGLQDTIDLGQNISIEFLNQKYYTENASTENNYSVCFQINQNNEKYYLFTGDLESDGEASLVSLNQNKLHEVALYKAGHHGSKTSSSSVLLSVIKPEVVCVCCCAGSSEYTSTNANQFPTQDFINRVSQYTDKIFVTTLCLDYSKNEYTSMNGCIVFTFNNGGTTPNIYCSNNSTILKETEWFVANRTMPSSWVA